MDTLILLVDDEEAILAILEAMLETHFLIRKASDGREALAILAKEPVDLVISDVTMPYLNGFELCQHIKSTVELSLLPVILLTARNGIEAKVTGLELCADAYIEKPFSTEFLLAQVNSLLSNRRKIKEFFTASPLAFIQGESQNGANRHFLQELEKRIIDHIDDATLDMEKLARLMHMSRISLYRKAKASSDLSPAALVNVCRLKKAAELLAQGKYRVNEVSVMVGYNSSGGFSRSFTRLFNITPLEYAQQWLGASEPNVS